MFAGDRDRDRVEAALREHYVGGRLTLDELSERTERAVAARSRAELRRALSGLPVLADVGDIAAPGRALGQMAVRGAMLVVFTGAYLLFSLALLFVLGLTLLIQGASSAVLLAFLAVWLVPTYLLSRLWHRTPLWRRPST